MRTIAGRVSGIAAAPPATDEHVERFARALQTALGTRRDRNRNLTAWIAAVAAAPPGPLCVAALAAASSANVSPKQLRHAIERAPLDEGQLRRHLVKAAPLADVVVFTVEHDWVPHDESKTELDLYSLHATGPNWTIPIGWVVEPIPPAERDGHGHGR